MQTTTQSLFAHAVRSMISRGLWLPVYSLSFVQMISGEFCNNKMARDQNFVALKALIAIRKYELTYLNRKIKTYENSDGIIHFFLSIICGCECFYYCLSHWLSSTGHLMHMHALMLRSFAQFPLKNHSTREHRSIAQLADRHVQLVMNKMHAALW